ncbi:hydroxyacid oxidase 1 [Lingula anatina]|uniref:(S)-2-hydroxy-acid oxidase n=1 Tax=Lingula anatina TaxID=7574 RepID=A0A1S3K608_LINAN|nr:hydroxyacid oxidase 1 [Lingula anatina]|eukprot:XP_013417864.1 hydroxyacid oxidase 1 [Lingula anatina]
MCCNSKMAATQLVCVDDFEKYACDNLDKHTLEYYRSGANEEQTLADNRSAFKRYRLRPRFLHRDVTNRDMSTTIQGQPIDFPICISPSGLHKLVHPDGELATARAAASMKTCMALSTGSTYSMEDVANAAPHGLRWFQLYISPDREMTKHLVRRAERSGYKGLLLTIDTPLSVRRLSDTKNKFVMPKHIRLGNFMVNEDTKDYDFNASASNLFDAALSWKDVRWLKQFSSLPLIVKGVLTAEDAIEAVNCGVDGVFVSNHGGRRLDCVPASIDVLAEVVRAVAGRCEVYLDSGVRTGTDVLKALALGARAVFIGRPALYGLAYDGEAGVRQVLEILKSELSLAMALSGCACLDDIKRELVVHESHYLRPKL